MNVLVVGPAKTGTTVVSKAIHQALPGSEYRLEPRGLGPFVHPIDPPGVVVKIIFEHWVDRPHLRDAIVHGEMPLRFDKVVATVRDPRDELVSRMYFVARERTKTGAVSDQAVDEWITLLRAKESAPGSVSFSDLCAEARRLLGVELSPRPGVIDRYRQFVAGLPKKAFLLRYEDFVAGRTEGLATYLGRSVLTDPELGSVAYTKRSAATGEWRKIFVESDVDAMRPAFAPRFTELGYDDWELEPVSALAPETRSEYVRRLVDEAREGRGNPDAPIGSSIGDSAEGDAGSSRDAGRSEPDMVRALGRSVVKLGKFLERSSRDRRRR